MRKDAKDRKDTRCTKYAYCNSCFFILLLIKSRLELPYFKQLVYFIYKYKTKEKIIHILKNNKISIEL